MYKITIVGLHFFPWYLQIVNGPSFWRLNRLVSLGILLNTWTYSSIKLKLQFLSLIKFLSNDLDVIAICWILSVTSFISFSAKIFTLPYVKYVYRVNWKYSICSLKLVCFLFWQSPIAMVTHAHFLFKFLLHV